LILPPGLSTLPADHAAGVAGESAMADHQETDREGRVSPVALIALCCIAPLSALAVAGIAPVMPLITQEYAANPQAGMLVRLMMSGLSAATIAGALVSGLLAARIGTLRLLVACAALYALAGAAVFVIDSLHAIVACRMLQGVANGGLGVLALAVITTRVQPDRRNAWIGFYSVTGTVGVLFLLAAVGAIAELGWRHVFLMFALALPVALVIALTFPSAVPEGGEQAGPAQTVAAGRIPWGMAGFGLLCGAIITTISMYLPYHLADIGLGAPDKVALMMIAGAGAAGLPALGFGRIRARFSAIATFVIGFSVTGVGLVMLALSQSLPMALAAMLLHGLGLGTAVPNLFSAVAEATAPEQRARVIGFVRAAFYAGPLAAQPLLELVYAARGAAAALVAIALACLTAAVLSVLIRRIFTPVALPS